jgi:hypothetical protein
VHPERRRVVREVVVRQPAEEESHERGRDEGDVLDGTPTSRSGATTTPRRSGR